MAFLDEELKENAQESVEETVQEPETATEEVVVRESPEETQTVKDSKKRGNKKPSKVKGAFSELKKVTWPSFGSVVKKTAVVLSVTAIFLVVVIGIDQLLYLLYNLLTKNM